MEIININSAIKTMSSREIADLTGKRHDNIIQLIRKLESDHILTPELQEIEYKGRFLPCYLLGKRDSMVLVARLSPEFTAEIVDRWQELEMAQAPSVPQTYAAALVEAGRLAQLVDDQAVQIAAAAPKVEYHDRVISSDGGLLSTEIASELGMSAIILNKELERLGIQRKVNKRWVLTAGSMGKGLTIESTFIDAGNKSRHSMKWTEIGRKYIHDIFDK